MKIPHNITIEDIQRYLTYGAVLHPQLDNHYNHLLHELSLKGKCSLLPCVALEYYSTNMNQKINQKAA